jgi:hypothetical protein
MRRIVNTTLFLLILTPILAYPVRTWLIRDFYWTIGTITFLLAIFILFQKISTNKKIIFPKYLTYLFFGFVYYLLRGAENDYVNYKGFLSFIYRNPALYTLAVFFVVENISISLKQVELYYKIFFLTLIFAVIVTLIQVTIFPYFYTFREVEITGFEVEEFRYRSIFSYSSSNDIGLSFVPIVAILLYNPKFQDKRYTKYAIMFLSFIVVFFSAARYIYLAFLIVVIPHFKLKNIISSIVFIVVFYFLLSIVLKEIGFNFSSFYEDRILDESYTSRFTAVENFINLFPLNPMFGTGVHIDENLRKVLQGSSQMHVGVLSHLYEYGIVGSIFWFGVMLSLSLRLYKQSKLSGNWAGFYGYMVYVSANLTLVAYDMYFYGLIFCILLSKYYYLKKKLELKEIFYCETKTSNNNPIL